MPDSERVLLLGGTREAVELAAELTRAGHQVITSIAGRTREPREVAGEMRVGGFGGAEKMAQWIRDNHIEKVIDATHPFATQISANARRACTITDVPLDIRRRKPWPKMPADDWIEVADLKSAATTIPTRARVLLAIGSQHIQPFSSREDVDFFIRMVDPPQEPLNLTRHTLILGRPSKDWRNEAQLMSDNQITHVVCRNSGGAGAYGKIIAARELAIPVIIIKMPI